MVGFKAGNSINHGKYAKLRTHKEPSGRRSTISMISPPLKLRPPNWRRVVVSEGFPELEASVSSPEGSSRAPRGC